MSTMPPAVEPAVLADRAWIVRVGRQGEDYGLWGDVGRLFWRHTIADRHVDHWDVIRPYAWVHWRLREDGWRTLYEIMTDEAYRGLGYGRALVEHIGAPCMVKADRDNKTANAFYKALGFRLVDATASRKGKWLNVWVKTCAAS